jgi:6-phospho-beta-glucosidase
VKVCVVGGGSTYTPELVDGFIRRAATLPIRELHLLDPNRERLEIVGRFADRMCEAARSAIAVTWGDDPVAAISGADFVVTQLRVGGQAARHRDELMGRDFGLIGQETTGIGGFAKGLRTIPVMLEIARLVREHAPTAVLVNFTNPAGMITETLRRHTDLTVVGLCNVPWNMKIEVAEALGADVGAIELDYVGLNHLSWVRGFRVEGEDRTAEVFDRTRAKLGKGVGAADEPDFDPGLIGLIGAVPNYYLMYFYETAAMLRHQETHPTRASEVMAIERALLARYEEPRLVTKPPELMERGGAYYSESAAALMADIHADAGTVHIVNTTNDGAIPGLPDDVVVETAARITRSGAHAIATTELRPDIDAMVRTVKDYELLTIEAALSGDADLALLALATNPLGPDMRTVRAVWDRIRRDNEGFLGRLDG